MQQSSAPSKLTLPFANAGGKNTIPVASSATPGAASYTDGFPPLTRTALASGGVPPSGLDMNGILFGVSAMIRWLNAGGAYPYDSAFASDSNVGGYPKGSRVLRSDGTGYWLNTSDNNSTDPEAGGAGWVPDVQSGSTSVTMTNANVTLTSAQAGKEVIIITGTITANLNLIFPTYILNWNVINNTTGAFTITAKTASGTGVALNSSGITSVVGDGTNIVNSSPITATTSVKGISQLATSAEVLAGTDSSKTITPSTLLAGLLGAGGISANDYVILPYKDKSTSVRRNLIIQWGTVTSSTGGDTSVTFPIAFPTAFLNSLATVGSGTTSVAQFGSTGAATLTTLAVSAWSTAGARVASPLQWFAIGY